MPKFTSKTQTQETAIFASSGGEGVHGESTSPVVAAIAGIQLNLNTTPPVVVLASTVRVAAAVPGSLV